MKNYLCAKDRTAHIIITAMQYILEDFNKSDSLSDEEHQLLDVAHKNIKAVNDSLFERLGEPYRRKIVQTMASNDLRFVGKFSVQKEAISYADIEDLAPMINEIIDLKCCDCSRCDFKSCAVYGIAIACDVGARSETSCPFKW